MTLIIIGIILHLLAGIFFLAWIQRLCRESGVGGMPKDLWPAVIALWPVWLLFVIYFRIKYGPPIKKK